MTWTTTVIVFYLIFGWLTSFIVVFAFCEKEGDETGTQKQLTEFLKRQPVLFLVFRVLTAIVIGPVTLLLLVYGCVEAWCEWRQWRRLRRTHRPVLLEPKTANELPKQAREHFAKLTPKLEALGFSREGTYLYKPEPFAVHCVTLLGTGGDTIADISYLDGETAYSFTSVLAGGQVLETACSESVMSMNHVNASRRFHADMVERSGEHDRPDLVYQRHRQTLTELADRYESHPLSFAPAQMKGVMTYANDLMDEVKYDIGELDEPKPTAVFPASVA